MKNYLVTQVIWGTSKLSSLSSIHEKNIFLNLNQSTKQTGTNMFLNTNIWDCVYEQSSIELLYIPNFTKIGLHMIIFNPQY